MKKEKIELLESYFKTEDEYLNGFTFKITCKTVLSDLFEDPETPLRVFRAAIDNFTEQAENPLKAFFQFKDSTGKITKSYAAFDRNFYVERINNIDSIITNPSPEIQVGTKFTQYNLLQKFKYIQCDNIEHTLSFHLTNTSDVPRYDR